MISPVSTAIDQISQNVCALASSSPTPLRTAGDAPGTIVEGRRTIGVGPGLASDPARGIVEVGHAVAVDPRLAGHPASGIVKDRLGNRRPDGNY
jgi:hypothetical protein